MKERDALRQILDYLAAEGVLAFRRNVGAVKDGKRFFRFGTPGEADIEAFMGPGHPPIWIEVKGEGGRQRPEQESFEKLVRSWGHGYVVARSVEDVEPWIHPERMKP